MIIRELREWHGHAIPLEGKRVFDFVGDLHREHIGVEVEVRFRRRAYNETKSRDSNRFRVVGVRIGYADDGYRLYITNLAAEEFTVKEIATPYRARWEIELLFRELKSRYSSGRSEMQKAHIVRIQVLAVLLTLTVSRAVFRMLVDHDDATNRPSAG